MQELYTLNLGTSEVNFIADAVDSYRYAINRLMDEQSQGNINKIVENIYAQLQNVANSVAEDIMNDEGVIIDVEPEVIPHEESEAE